MILRINPNRMELLRLRKRLALARRGHKLLQDKLEEMMRRFLALLKGIEDARSDFEKRTKDILNDLVYCRITSPREDFEESLAGIDVRLRLNVATSRILNVKVPAFSVEGVDASRNYDFFRTSGQLDFVAAGAGEYVRSLLKLAQLVKALDILSYEIERTRRRVNALEYILIPSIVSTLHFIAQKLNELERSNIVRLMRVKELIEAR